jgi:cell division protein FtsL
MVGATVMAVLLTLPPLLYVSQRAQRAETGYAILRHQHELVKLRAENARLSLQASALKSPQRIEYYATTELGMVPPHQRQLATITVGPAIAQVEAPTERPGVLRQLASWFGRSEAEARERPR